MDGFSIETDPLKSPDNWTFTFGEQSNTNTNFYFALNKVFLFKGMVESKVINASDPVSTENNNSLCTRELIGGAHMVCLECSDAKHTILVDKVACLPS